MKTKKDMGFLAQVMRGKILLVIKRAFVMSLGFTALSFLVFGFFVEWDRLFTYITKVYGDIPATILSSYTVFLAAGVVCAIISIQTDKSEPL